MKLPPATKRIVIPSSQQTNLSFNKIGEKIAEKTIVRQEVEAIKIILPRIIAATLDNYPHANNNNPVRNYH